MKAYEFPTKVTPEGKLEIPEDISSQLPPNQAMRAIILVAEDAEDEAAWARLTCEQFLAGYDESDSIYDRT
jgi:hypothetical protein